MYATVRSQLTVAHGIEIKKTKW